jgi:hypothetical protein
MKRKAPNRNPVARHAGRFNHATVFRDRTRYSRKPKHKGRESFSMAVSTAAMAKDSRPELVIRQSLDAVSVSTSPAMRHLAGSHIL